MSTACKLNKPFKEVHMKKFISIVLSTLIIGAALFTYIGCSSSSDAPPTVEETSQVVEGANVGYPPEEWTDALEAFSMISFIDIFTMYANLYLDTELFDWQGSDGTYTLSYSDGVNDFTLTLRIVWDEAKGMWHYTLTLDGTIDSEPYNNFMIFEMYATPDGNRGEIDFYNPDPDYPDDYLTVTWDKGTTYITFTMSAQFESESFTITLKETIPVYDGAIWRSENGRLRIEVPPDTDEVFTWGPSPPDF
jgi:hypothetical protein